MRNYRSWFLVFAFIAVACSADTANKEADDSAATASLECLIMGENIEERLSPLQEVRFAYEGGGGLLCYGAPSAREREIMGGLVPFGELWRGGANEPTTLHLSASATLGDISLEAGSYSIYMIPRESEWEFFVNSNFERWGVPIDDDVRSTEIGSFTVTAGSTDEMVETLLYEHMEGHLMLSWENTQVHIPFGT
tara:strand:- start:6682 stop:7263 length:582 start_codon:yes stop_codon:yes gene_type:complete